MFQSTTGASFVAHQYMIAGQSGNASGNPSGTIWGCDADASSRVTIIGPNGTELPGPYPCFDYATMADLLDAKGISWRYYAPGSGDGFSTLSAFQAIRHIRFGPDWTSNVVSPQSKVLTDIKNGQLAQVTWIVPALTRSDHPASGSNEGPDCVGSIVVVLFWLVTLRPPIARASTAAATARRAERRARDASSPASRLLYAAKTRGPGIAVRAHSREAGAS